MEEKDYVSDLKEKIANIITTYICTEELPKTHFERRMFLTDLELSIRAEIDRFNTKINQVLNPQ